MPKVRARVPSRYRSTTTAAADVPTTGGQPLPNTWEGVLVLEGIPTGDGRLMEPGSLRWENLPLPLRWARADNGAHQGAVTVGRILEIWRDGSEVRARGDLDYGSDEGREIGRLLDGDENGPILNGVSVDLDDVDVEVRVAAEVLDATEAMFADTVEDGGEGVEREVDEEGRVTVWEFATDDEMFVTTDGRIRAATIVDVPAFIGARLSLVAGLTVPDDAPPLSTIVAGAAPNRPPREWFGNPGFGDSAADDPRLVHDASTGITAAPLTVAPDGRIFGHIAAWRTCHTGYAECVNPPTSASGYRYFHVGAVVCADGTEVPTGRITLDTLHAGRRLSAVDTLAHYENTGLAVADVCAGEDAHGIWIAGGLRSRVTDEQIRALRASPLSGDWRRIGGSLELVAALAVNSPGFPIPRALVASGEIQTLQTGGIAPKTSDVEPLTEDEMAILRRMAAREAEASARRRADADTARRRLLVASAAARMHGR
jgi:hypothetical protein